MKITSTLNVKTALTAKCGSYVIDRFLFFVTRCKINF